MSQYQSTEVALKDSDLNIAVSARPLIDQSKLKRAWKILDLHHSLEEWRALDPNSELGVQFQHEMEGFVSLFLPDALKPKEFPVRFLFSKLESANAWCTMADRVPTIVVTHGLFREVNVPDWFISDRNNGKYGEISVPYSGKDLVVSQPSELAYIIAHEYSHFKFVQEVERPSNSKWEEGFAYSNPIAWLRVAGFNPFYASYVLTKLGVDAPDGGILQLALDPHPTLANARKIVSDTLAIEISKFGSEARKFSDPGRNEFSSLMNIALSAGHDSYLDKILGKNETFAALPLEKRVSEICQYLNSFDVFYNVRVADLVGRIKGLKTEIKGDTTSLEILTDAVISFVDRSLLEGNAERLNQLGDVYRAVAELHETRFLVAPVGRFARIDQAIRKLVSVATSTDSTDNEITLAAEKLVTIVDSEPLRSTPTGASFLQGITWSNFESPEIDDRMARRLEKSRDSSGIVQISQKGSGPLVSWHKLRNLASKNEAVLRSGHLLGLDLDYAFIEARFSFAKYREDLIRHREVSLRPELSRLARSPNRSGMSLRGYVIARDGRLQEIPPIRADRKSPGQDCADQILDRLVKGYFDSKMQSYDKTPLSEHEINELKLIRESRGYLPKEAIEKLGPDSLAVFVEIFGNSVATDLKFAQSLITKIEEMLESNSQGVRDKVRQALSGLIGMTKGQISIEMQIGLMHMGVDYERAFDEHPYFVFFLFDRHQLFSVDQQINAISQMLPKHELLNRAPLPILSKLQALLKAGGHLDINFKMSWKAILAASGNFVSKSPLEDLLLYSLNDQFLCLAALQLVRERNFPNSTQILQFLKRFPRVLDQEVYRDKEAVNLREVFRELTQKRLSKFFVGKNLLQKCEIFSTLSSFDLLTESHTRKIAEDLIQSTAAERDAGLAQKSAELLLRSGITSSILERETLSVSWARAVKRQLGLDNGSQEYFARFKTILDGVTKLSRADRARMFQLVAKEIQAQTAVCTELRNLGRSFLRKLSDQEIVAGAGGEVVLNIANQLPRFRRDILEFLLSTGSVRDVNDFAEHLAGYAHQLTGTFDNENDEDSPDEDSYKSRQITKTIYQNFWALPLELRAVLVRELLLEKNQAEFKFTDQSFDYVMKRTVVDDQDYAAISKAARAYLDAAHYTQRALLLTALMIGAQRSSVYHSSLGEALAQILERIDPAVTKVGQAAASHPDTREDIREDLQRLKFKADEPVRFELVRWVDGCRQRIEDGYNQWLDITRKPSVENPGQSERVFIKRIGEVVGSASLFVDVRLEMSDGTDRVLAILRPHARSRAEHGFDVLAGAWGNLGAEHPAANVLRELIWIAKARIETEVDVTLAPEQYERGRKMYQGLKVEVNGEIFNFTAAQVITFGKAVVEEAVVEFFLMDEIQGDHFLELKDSAGAKNIRLKNTAQAIFTAEISKILQCEFDSDRHGGQMKILDGTIGHFDFKGLGPNRWVDSDYTQFATVLVALLPQLGTKQDMGAAFLDAQRRLRENKEEIGNLVMEVQRALIPLGEYVRYLDVGQIKDSFLAALKAGVSPALAEKLVNAVPSFLKSDVENLLFKGAITGLLQGIIGHDENSRVRLSVDRS